jgi:DAK2 domain fusion protein YloV
MSTETSLGRFRAVVEGALGALEARRQEVNDLNVFPVADGDTGDNMALTLEAVLSELDRLAALGDVDDVGRDAIVRSVARAALLGARGNSGVILSQLIRGAAEELISRPGELVDPVLLAAAMARAADQAYRSVRAPAEGTILTVIREMAGHMTHVIAHSGGERLDADAAPTDQDSMLARILTEAVGAGEESVNRGPDLLPVLAEAGVVDAGGYGLVILFAGVIGALQGAEPPQLAHHAPPRVTHPQHSSSSYRYCVNFAVTGTGLPQRAATLTLESLGDSVLVVGDESTLKVHVHTDSPDAATGVFAETGSVSHLDVADMHEQVAVRAARLETVETHCTVVAVVSNAEMANLFERTLGVDALEGGPTLNPSTYELLASIHSAHSEEVVVLPNSSNVVMAAQKAAELSEKRVTVLPTRSQQAGLVAITYFEPGRDAAENVEIMERELAAVRTGGVAPAARDDGQGRFHVGDAVGYVDEELVAWGDPETTLREVFARLGDGAEILTAIRGDGAPLDDAALVALAPDGVEVEPKQGGQPSWWWLLSAE